MTVRELICELKNLPPEMRIVVRGYENGFNDIISLKKHNIAINAEAEWWDGKYQEDNNSGTFQAIEIFGDNGIQQT